MAFILSVDFDGTLVEGSYPEKGAFKTNIIDKVKEFATTGQCEIVLWTCREGKALEEAVSRCKEVGLTFDAINNNSPTAARWIENETKKSGDTFAGRKIYADFYVDDKAMNLDVFLKINIEETCKNFANREK